MQQFRRGDVVSIEGTVTYHSDDSALVHVSVGVQDTLVAREAITLVRPHVDPGDEVIVDGETAVVIAVNEATAWVKCAGSGNRFAHIIDLKRKEGEQEQ